MTDARLTVPPDACDCHVHVFEEGFAVAPTAVSKPPIAPLADYRDVQRALGLTRAVIVQPTAYGFDNTCTLDAVAALGSAARGVVVIAPDTPAAELQRLHDRGVRGVRYMMLPGGALGWDGLETTAASIAPLDWHIDLQIDGRRFPEYEERLLALPCRLVVDHNGKFLTPVAPTEESFQSLLRLLAAGRCWVKLSAPYETSRTGPPGYDDVSLLARTLVKANPQRCLWACNWPHLNTVPLPSNSAMLDMLLAWAPDDATRRQILVDNPAQLYGFS
jgi:D-galactarolactone isomerase